MSNTVKYDFAKRIALPAIVYGWLGWWLASKLSAAPALHVHKVHFVIGLAFEIAGVAALSHIVANNKRVQAFLVGPFLEHLCFFLISAHVGIIARAFLGSGGSSEKALEELAMQLLFFVVRPFIVFVPQIVVDYGKIVWTSEGRANTLGLTLLLLGLVLQLFAAVHDLFQ